ncbi:MAG: hypothetical protein JSW66_12220 [Phycisphaerales bacterium]|nr:MAG: hypothetical protein JSW66_12220 [Phycisphaerales bacterium]
MWKLRIDCMTKGIAVCVLFMTAGCGDLSRKPAPAASKPDEQGPLTRLALKFAPGDSTTYRVTRETDKSVEWEGPASNRPKGFTGGHTGSKIEMAFTQHIQSADGAGSAAARITITQLKYLATVKDHATMDFDSSREKDLSSPLGKLIGQSYIVELTASGQVSKVIDATEARAAVMGDSAAHKTASNLLSAETIKQLHAISPLPAADKNQLQTGQTWSSLESFSFDLMGAKAYEKIYTLKEIREVENRRIAIARMEAVPSAEMAKELHKEQNAAFFSNMFDNTETFTGDLKLDLTDGKVEQWSEQLLTEWFIVDPNPKDPQQPAALRMTATRLHSIERTD